MLKYFMVGYSQMNRERSIFHKVTVNEHENNSMRAYNCATGMFLLGVLEVSVEEGVVVHVAMAQQHRPVG